MFSCSANSARGVTSMETYTIVRVCGLLQHLLKKTDYEVLLEEDGIWRFPAYSHISPDDPLEDVLAKIDGVMVDRFNFLSKIKSRYTRLITAFADRLELENLKIKLREIYGKKERYEIYIPYSHFIPIEDLLKVKKEEEVWRLVLETPYWISSQEPPRKDLLSWELYLDSKYYLYLKESLPSLERRTLGEIVDLESFIAAIYWMVVVGEEDIIDLIARDELTGLKPHFVESEVSLSGYIGSLGLEHREAVRLIRENEISLLLKKLREKFLEVLSNKAGEEKFSVALTYYYLTLVKAERDNLHRIIIGKKLGLPPEKIRRVLLFG